MTPILRPYGHAGSSIESMGGGFQDISWDERKSSSVKKRDDSHLPCRNSFSEGNGIPICTKCASYPREGYLWTAAQLHDRLG